MMLSWWLFGMLVTLTTGYMDESCRNENPDCVCEIVESIRKILSLVGVYEGTNLEKKIQEYECRILRRLPKSLQIDTTDGSGIFESSGRNYGHNFNEMWIERKKEYKKKRKKRYVNLGVPTNQAFNEAIAHVHPHSLHQYILLGSSVTFHCSEGSEETEYENPSYLRSITWMHYNGEPITAAQTTLERSAETLTIPSVQLSDIGIYNCTKRFSSNDNSGDHLVTTAHQLSVISESIFWLKLSVNYETIGCNQEEMSLIRNHIKFWIKTHVCSICEIHNTSIICTVMSSRSNYKIRGVVSAIGLNLEMDRMEFRFVDTCRVSCQETIHAKILELVRDSIMKLFRLPIDLIGNGGRKLRHFGMENSLEIKLLLGCLAGFHLKWKLCFPCTPGHFSKEGNTDCLPCEIGSYQPHLASTSCIPCHSGLKTKQPASTHSSHCHNEGLLQTAASITTIYTKYKVIGGVFGTILLLIILIPFFICLCCPKSPFGQFVRKYCCCCWKMTNGYEKLDDQNESDSESKYESKLSTKKNEKGRTKKVLRTSIPPPPPLPTEKMLSKTKESSRKESKSEKSKTDETRKFLQLEVEEGEAKSSNKIGKQRTAVSAMATTIPKNTISVRYQESGGVGGTSHIVNSRSRSHHSEKQKEEIVPGSEEEEDSDIEPDLIESDTLVLPFNNVVEELKHRFSLVKPIGESEDSDDKGRTLDQSTSNSSSEIIGEVEECLSRVRLASNNDNNGNNEEDILRDEEGRTDEPYRPQECFKPTPLRQLITWHNETENNLDPASDEETLIRNEKHKDQSEPLDDSLSPYVIPPPPPLPPNLLHY